MIVPNQLRCHPATFATHPDTFFVRVPWFEFVAVALVVCIASVGCTPEYSQANREMRLRDREIVAVCDSPMTYGDADERAQTGSTTIWPVSAIVVRNRNNPPFGTLYFLVGEDIDLDFPVQRLEAVARFSHPCKTYDLRGDWVEVPGGFPVFVLSYESGGTMGIAIEVFSHQVQVEESGQVHTFKVVFSDGSRCGAYFGNQDSDPYHELFICAESLRAGPESDWDYEVFQLTSESVSWKASISDSEFCSIRPTLDLLTRIWKW